MRRVLRAIAKFVAYFSAAIVILLAIAVGLFRLFLPRLPEYQEEIKNWASAAVGMRVEFSGMDARWGLSGPELEFYDAELIRVDSEIRVIAAEEVRVGVGLVRLMVDRTLVVDRVVVRNTTIEVQRRQDGSFWVQGSRLDDLLAMRSENAGAPAAIDLIGEQIELSYLQPGDERPLFFSIPRLRLSVDNRRIAADGSIALPESLGSELSISATQIFELPRSHQIWDVSVDAEDVLLAGWSDLLSLQRGFAGGQGNVKLSLQMGGRDVNRGTAEISFVGAASADGAPFDVAGRVEVDLAGDGWLVAADDLVLRRDGRQWPASALRLETGTDGDGDVVMLDARASYLNLGDAEFLSTWLDDKLRDQLMEMAPSGELHDVRVTLSGLDTDAPRYNVDAVLDAVGIAAAPGRPGVRGLSGQFHASHSGGSLVIDASTVEVDLTEFVDNRVVVDASDSMIFWRLRDGQLSIWSDGLQLANEFFSSYSDVDLVFGEAMSGPEIALSSTWSISDIAAARRLIPRAIMKPQLYDWFQMSLRSGSIPHGTTELHGPLDRFPFDDGEGQFLINASVRDLDFKFHRDWPASQQADLEVVLNKVRLYSEKNRSVTLGNTVVDAKVEIADLRDPVLTIESITTGTLESIRQYSRQSPIARVFGGNLDRVSVSGDASFSLDLVVPLKRQRLREFEFETRIRSNDGSLQLAGFDAPVTDLSGEVTISRNAISSDALRGSFLGRPVDIELTRATDAGFSVLASATGTLTRDGVIDGLGVPLDGLIDGEAGYTAQILFPGQGLDQPPPLTVRVASDLQGFALQMPSPLAKPAGEALGVRGEILFPAGGEAISSSGETDNGIAWRLDFNRPEGLWDLDRGVVMFGSEPMQEAATRGLHLRGNTTSVSLSDWLAVSRSGEKSVGAADRIRSIDLVIDDFLVLGQRLTSHRVRVDRSARDWLVQIDGDDIAGSVFVPYEFGGDRAMVLDMQRMRLPGDDDDGAGDQSEGIDPRRLPPLQLQADEFAFGDRYVGRVEANFVKIPLGLESTKIRATDPSFDIVGNGRWIIDPTDDAGSRSFVTATLSSRDVEETMRRLNYQPGIASESMNILLDLEWSGGPRADIFGSLDGEVQVRLGNGQLEEVEPGAGRMFGLMSIAALPRRLSLDFRDVFSRGFGFDTIAGTFRLDDGRLYTCDLALEGPAANVGVVGAADIVTRSYDQTAVVSANVGNTLPIVGAVVAGPQAAAALLIFSQIFKKPLEEAGQVYYDIDGSWDEPMVDSADSAAFVASSELAGCLASTE